MLVSLCMIVKNEENTLKRCIDSVKEFVEEIIIVDTGSIDRTVAIAEGYGARIYEYPWDGSFANARNFALEHANMDWILLMDGDDELEKKDVPKILRLLSKDSGDAYFFKTVSYLGERPDINYAVANMNIRLIRNRMFRFEGDIHEQIVPVNPQKSVIKTADINVYHYGYLNAAIESKNKRERNVSMLLKELERNPENPFTFFNLGNEYSAIGKTEEALGYYIKSYEHFEPGKGFSSKLIFRIVTCFDMLGKREEQIRFIEEGLRIYPKFTDLEFLRGNLLMREEKYLPAIASFKKCLKMGEAPDMLSYIVGAGSFKAQLCLSSISQKLGDTKLSMRYCKMAIKNNPRYRHAYSQMYGLLFEKGVSPLAIAKKLRRYACEMEEADTCVMLSDVFYLARQYRLALIYAKRAAKSSDEATPRYYEGVCHVYLKQYKKAVSCFKRVSGSQYAEKAAYLSRLCACFDSQIHLRPQAFEGPYFKVLAAFEKIASEEHAEVLAEDEEASKPYLKPIFDLLDLLLKTENFDLFDQARQLLNLITDESVLMGLGKLYYNNLLYKFALEELTRSIKLTGKTDPEALQMMKYMLEAKLVPA